MKVKGVQNNTDHIDIYVMYFMLFGVLQQKEIHKGLEQY